MDIKEIRRIRLKDWFANKTLPEKEKSYLSQLINGKGSFGERAARRLELDYGMPIGSLDTKLDAETSNVAYASSHHVSGSYPLISWVSAGAWHEAIEPYRLSEIEDWPETTEKVSDKSFWLTVKGDSMTSPSGQSVPEGMLILVDPEREPVNGSLVVAKLVNENEATFKKLVIDAGQKYLKPLNPDYKMQTINGNCKIVGVVVEAKVRFI
jgi:SOS-response transcriptional repressor LexA